MPAAARRRPSIAGRIILSSRRPIRGRAGAGRGRRCPLFGTDAVDSSSSPTSGWLGRPFLGTDAVDSSSSPTNGWLELSQTGRRPSVVRDGGWLITTEGTPASSGRGRGSTSRVGRCARGGLCGRTCGTESIALSRPSVAARPSPVTRKTSAGLLTIGTASVGGWDLATRFGVRRGGYPSLRTFLAQTKTRSRSVVSWADRGL